MVNRLRPTKENKYTRWPASYRRKPSEPVYLFFCGSLNGDEIMVGNISHSGTVAIGREATATTIKKFF